MTREEAIKLIDTHTVCFYNEIDSPTLQALHLAIEALQAEPVIDKIRAEIKLNAYPIVHGVNNHELGMTLYGILQIFDKYKAED